ncbi:MAG: hypothetical protein U0T03_04760 [Xanthomonadales bacterium]|nr:hypothetical protein [Xanthomonadales bacterium]
MKEIFLSSSVPEHGRGNFYESADPFLIQFAVRELLTVCLGRRRVVWGGHPSITPMVHAVCKDFGMEFEPPVVLYQSRFFENRFPEDNKYFETVLVDGVEGDLANSLVALRRAMLSRPIQAAVFIGGMEGIFQEYAMFQELHGPNANAVALGAPGGAARQLAEDALLNGNRDPDLDRIDFARLLHERLGISPEEERQMKSGEAKDDGSQFNA